MQQIPYSIIRMLCHILIGFVGGTLFLTSGKALTANPLQDGLVETGLTNGTAFVSRTPIPEIAYRTDLEAATGETH